MQNAERRTQNAERRTQNAERKTQNAKRRTQNAETLACNLPAISKPNAIAGVCLKRSALSVKP
jgi:hypothetical protein